MSKSLKYAYQAMYDYCAGKGDKCPFFGRGDDCCKLAWICRDKFQTKGQFLQNMEIVIRQEWEE